MKKSIIVIGIDRSQIDSAPTILNSIDAPIPSYLNGKNLLANLLSV